MKQGDFTSSEIGQILYWLDKTKENLQWKDNILKMLHENGIKCPCGGYFNDWHSHDSDCVVINPRKKEVKFNNGTKESEQGQVKRS